MKTLILTLLFSVPCFAQEYSEQKMYRTTGEAIAKFYGLDVIGDEAFRRLQERVLPEEYKQFIPYFGTLTAVFVNKNITFRKDF